ncbi:hypothetical protein BpHYR1_012922 [Brachionus plicatilis]|uniref:Uncharacterized protein n=1 Tax=Brachionus plicatilis TaxID=10195 RepID=A0A3M7P976_BRAPC|nr:hypothetical protein BpHYR1_012922 [Brachionus plicatilis]
MSSPLDKSAHFAVQYQIGGLFGQGTEYEWSQRARVDVFAKCFCVVVSIARKIHKLVSNFVHLESFSIEFCFYVKLASTQQFLYFVRLGFFAQHWSASRAHLHAQFVVPLLWIIEHRAHFFYAGCKIVDVQGIRMKCVQNSSLFDSNLKIFDYYSDEPFELNG